MGDDSRTVPCVEKKDSAVSEMVSRCLTGSLEIVVPDLIAHHSKHRDDRIERFVEPDVSQITLVKLDLETLRVRFSSRDVQHLTGSINPDDSVSALRERNRVTASSASEIENRSNLRADSPEDTLQEVALAVVIFVFVEKIVCVGVGPSEDAAAHDRTS
jgi:hypothetical protein